LLNSLQAIRSGSKGVFIFLNKPGRFEQAPCARQMSGGRKPEEMAANQSGDDAVEFEQERSFESMERHDHDAADAGIRPLVSQAERPQPLSRLQKRAPAKLQLKKLSPESMGLSCRSPIPLLSPLVMSPLEGGDVARLLFSEEAERQNPEEEEEESASAVIPTNGWQHPAAPFFAERVCSFSHCFSELCIQDRCWS